MKRWKRDLSALTLDGPYSHHGGLKRLAADLGLAEIAGPSTVSLWMTDEKVPSPKNQAKLRALAEEVEA